MCAANLMEYSNISVNPPMEVKEMAVVENGISVVGGRKEHLQERLDRLEALYKDTRQELEATREALSKFQPPQMPPAPTHSQWPGGATQGPPNTSLTQKVTQQSGGTFKIFVGNLSDCTSQSDLRELFEPFGTVVEADVLKNYGFVHMQGEEEGQQAISALNGQMLNGKPLIVAVSTCGRRSTDQGSHHKVDKHRGNFKIFVGNLSHSATSGDVKNLFEQYGTIAEADVITVRGVKTYAFVHMVSREDGEAAIAALNGYVLHGRPMVVAASIAGRRPVGSQRIKIFVGNVNQQTTAEDLRSLFQIYGNVLEADIITNYAFVHMDDIMQGKRAIHDLDGYKLHGSSLSVQESRSRPQYPPNTFYTEPPQYNSRASPSFYRDPPELCLPTPTLYEPQYSRAPNYYRERYDPYLPPPAPHHARPWEDGHRIGDEESYHERYPAQSPHLEYRHTRLPSPPRFSSQRPF